MKMVDYRGFKFSKLNDPQFKHLKYLLFWPIFAVVFYFLERGWPGREYTYIYSPLDDMIPFCEFFVIPYLIWFAAIFLTIVYTLLYDVKSFEMFMKFIIITYSVAIIIYIIFPNAQGLRPAEFQRDNIFTRFMKDFYEFDTNTNVCPSIHVLGAIGCMFASWYTKHFKSIVYKIISAVICVSICLSTVFLKQHSILDVFPAIVIAVIAYFFAYKNAKVNVKRKIKKKQKA